MNLDDERANMIFKTFAKVCGLLLLIALIAIGGLSWIM